MRDLSLSEPSTGTQELMKRLWYLHSIQIWTGYEDNIAKYMPEGVQVDNYFTRP